MAEFISEGVQGTSRLRQNTATGGRQVMQVRTTTIDAVCAEGNLRPRLIKIDVEGAELAALRGARETIARLSPDAGLFVEMHPALWRGMGLSAATVQEELATQRLRVVPLRLRADPWTLEGECVRLLRE